MANIVVLYGTFEGHTRIIAERIAAILRSRGCQADSVDCAALSPSFTLATYNAAIIGASVHMGQHVESVARFVKAQRAWLNQNPSAFFSVSLMRSGQLEQHRLQAEEYIRTFLTETAWRPLQTAAFGGALLFSHYGFAQRFITSALARRALGRLDTSRDAVYTNWSEVENFTTAFLALLND